MRRLPLLLAGTLAVPVLMVGVMSLAVGGGLGLASAGSCIGIAVEPGQQPATGNKDGVNQQVAAAAASAGVRHKASDRVLLAAFEAGLVESGMSLVANDGRRTANDSPSVTDHDLLVAAQSLLLPYDSVSSDSDSVGPLQQRNSWGTVSQRMDPEQAFGLFYARAVPLDQAGFDGTAGELAQAVQISKYPSKYDQQQQPALTLLADAGKNIPVGCQPAADGSVTGTPAGYGTPGPCGLSPSTDYGLHLIRHRWPQITSIGGCATAGHVEDSYHYPDADGQAHALDVMVYTDHALGNEVAAWAIANHGPLHIVQVIYFGRIWEPATGWRYCSSPASSCAQNHFDHPHLSFQRGT